MLEHKTLQQVIYALAKNMSGRSTCKVSATVSRLLQQAAVQVFRDHTAGAVAVPKRPHAFRSAEAIHGGSDSIRQKPVSVTGTVVSLRHMPARAISLSGRDDGFGAG